MHCTTNMVCIDVQNRQNFEYNTVENVPFSKKAAVNRQKKGKQIRSEENL